MDVFEEAKSLVGNTYNSYDAAVAAHFEHVKSEGFSPRLDRVMKDKEGTIRKRATVLEAGVDCNRTKKGHNTTRMQGDVSHRIIVFGIKLGYHLATGLMKFNQANSKYR